MSIWNAQVGLSDPGDVFARFRAGHGCDLSVTFAHGEVLRTKNALWKFTTRKKKMLRKQLAAE